MFPQWFSRLANLSANWTYLISLKVSFNMISYSCFLFVGNVTYKTSPCPSFPSILDHGIADHQVQLWDRNFHQGFNSKRKLIINWQLPPDLQMQLIVKRSTDITLVSGNKKMLHSEMECCVECQLAVAVGRQRTSTQSLGNDSILSFQPDPQGCPWNEKICAGSLKVTAYCNLQRIHNQFLGCLHFWGHLHYCVSLHFEVVFLIYLLNEWFKLAFYSI